MPEGQRARHHRGGTGSHRPGPAPAHRRRGTHRPVHHRRLLEGQRARRHRGGTGSHRPGPRGTHRPVHHRRALKASALADIAGALAATDPDRAARLIADAERIAQSITDESERDIALATIVRILMATDPDRGLPVVRSGTPHLPRSTVIAHRSWILS